MRPHKRGVYNMRYAVYTREDGTTYLQVVTGKDEEGKYVYLILPVRVI